MIAQEDFYQYAFDMLGMNESDLKKIKKEKLKELKQEFKQSAYYQSILEKKRIHERQYNDGMLELYVTMNTDAKILQIRNYFPDNGRMMFVMGDVENANQFFLDMKKLEKITIWLVVKKEFAIWVKWKDELYKPNKNKTTV